METYRPHTTEGKKVRFVRRRDGSIECQQVIDVKEPASIPNAMRVSSRYETLFVIPPYEDTDVWPLTTAEELAQFLTDDVPCGTVSRNSRWYCGSHDRPILIPDFVSKYAGQWPRWFVPMCEKLHAPEDADERDAEATKRLVKDQIQES